jgi:hypothetical protein
MLSFQRNVRAGERNFRGKPRCSIINRSIIAVLNSRETCCWLASLEKRGDSS